MSRETVTNGAGLYTIPALGSGVYDLKATTIGFADSEKFEAQYGRASGSVIIVTSKSDYESDVADGPW